MSSGEKVDGDESGAASRQGIQSVELAVSILHALEHGFGPMTLSEIAEAAGMAPNKAHRYLVSLCRTGMVAQSQRSARYDLGPVMRRLGIEALRRSDEVGVTSDYMSRLRDQTGHSVNVAVWGDQGPVLVRWEYGTHALPITIRIGATMPLLTSSVGQVFLAYMPPTMLAPVLEQQISPQAVPEPAVIAGLQAEVREHGVAYTSGAVVPGMASIAAPVFPAAESLPLAVALALPMSMADEATIDALTTELLRTTTEITADLGGVAHRW